MYRAIFISFCFLQTAYSQPVKITPGKFQTGFTSQVFYDSSRPAIMEQPVNDKFRAIRVNSWYPAPVTKGSTMTFRDYILISAFGPVSFTQTSKDSLDAIDEYTAWPRSEGADSVQLATVIQKGITMRARSNVDAIQRNFPVVILLNGSAADYAFLGEYLASFGFYVMQLPVQGSLKKELDYQDKGLEAQLLDAEFALNKIPAVAARKVAVTGFSFGGQTAVAMAIRNKNINAVVSLDGGIGSGFGPWLLSQQPYYKPELFRASILHLYNPADTYTDLTWFNHITQATRYLVAMKNMQHGHFTAFGLLNRQVPGILGKKNPDPGPAYETVMLLTRNFLEVQLLKERTDPLKFLASATHGMDWLPATILKTEVKAAHY